MPRDMSDDEQDKLINISDICMNGNNYFGMKL